MKPQAAAGNAMSGIMQNKKMAANRGYLPGASKHPPGKGQLPPGKGIGGLGNPMMDERLNALRQQGDRRSTLRRNMPNIPEFSREQIGANPFASRENTITAGIPNLPDRPGGMRQAPGGMNPYSERLRQTGFNPAMMNSAVARLRPTGISDMSAGPPPIRATNPDMTSGFQQNMLQQNRLQQALQAARLRNQGGF